MNKRIVEIRERLKRATPLSSEVGTFCEKGIISYFVYKEDDGRKIARVLCGDDRDQELNDATLFASASSDIEYLLGKLEKCKAALEDLLSCAYEIETMTVPKAGIDAAPDQVVGVMHISYSRRKKWLEALAELEQE